MEPQASESEKLERLFDVEGWAAAGGLGVGCGGAGFERLKAEKSADGLGADTGVGAEGFCTGVGARAEGSAKSNRSIEAAGAAGLDAEGGALDAKLKSPKSFDEFGARLASGFCGGFEAIEGIDASFGPASKNPPPLRGGDVTCGGAAEDR